MEKEKEYKLTYEIKMCALDWVGPLIAFFIFAVLAIKNINYFIIINNELSNNIVFFGMAGYVCLWFLVVWLIYKFISNFGKWARQNEEGETIIEEIFFRGKLKNIEEVIFPQEPKRKKVKFKTIYQSK